jgi:SAM-dependent methyltransferase
VTPGVLERTIVLSPNRYHEISESGTRILNPLAEDKLLLLGEICRPAPGASHLDLACGKGELLCRFAQEHGTTGLGVDTYPPFLDIARARAVELGVSDRVGFESGDAAEFDPGRGPFDIVSCIGATWIGGGLGGTLDLLGRSLAPGGWVLVGEVFWAEEPPAGLRAAEEHSQRFSDLGGTLDVVEREGFELVEMVLASHDDWDRYSARQWLAVREWVDAHPGDPDGAELTRLTEVSRRTYLGELRRCMGWGVFVLREAAPSTSSGRVPPGGRG